MKLWRKAVKPQAAAPAAAPAVRIKPVADEIKPVTRAFPGPAGQRVVLRVALEREAYAEITAHARQSLEREVCGVLAGEVCADNEGLFVHVRAAIRGTAARAGGTHVTFTQETWNEIHQVLEKDYKGMRIVGWYHSHPGFGVEFSAMDRFIQQNFFPASTQVALVTDPLGGEVALGVNGPQDLVYADRFWVDGREQKTKVPAAAQAACAAPAAGTGAAAATLSPEWAAEMEQRLSQLVHAIDEQRAMYSRLLFSLFMLACLTAIVSIGYQVWNHLRDRQEPPRSLTTVPVPIQIGDKTMMVLIGVAGWQVPPEMNAVLLQLEKEKQAAQARAQQDAAAPSNTPSANPR